MSINPWNAGPGELPGDPENDPALWALCEACERSLPIEEVYWYSIASKWLCEECGQQYDEPPEPVAA